jgi:hypothetical protein
VRVRRRSPHRPRASRGGCNAWRSPARAAGSAGWPRSSPRHGADRAAPDRGRHRRPDGGESRRKFVPPAHGRGPPPDCIRRGAPRPDIGLVRSLMLPAPPRAAVEPQRQRALLRAEPGRALRLQEET